MYYFIAHYIDMRNDEDILKRIEIDMIPYDAEMLQGKQEEIAAWEFALCKAMDARKEYMLFYLLELLMVC